MKNETSLGEKRRDDKKILPGQYRKISRKVTRRVVNLGNCESIQILEVNAEINDGNSWMEYGVDEEEIEGIPGRLLWREQESPRKRLGRKMQEPRRTNF